MNKLKNNMTLLSSLDNRSRTILQHIVESYLETGNPIGSNTLSKKISPSLASATIRNVMSNLEGLNLLKSPHISAGRIPTETGLKLFIDGLLQVGDISSDEKKSIEALSAGMGKSLNNILSETSAALSGLSNCVSLVMAPTFERAIKHIEFVPIDNDKALVVIVDIFGLVENRIIDIPKGTPAGNLIEASNFINARAVGGTLEETKKQIEEELLIHRKEIDVISEKVIKAGLAVKTEDMDYPSLIVTGKNNIYSDLNTQEDFKKINELFEKIEQGQTLTELLKNSLSGTGVHVFIGADNKLFDYSGCSMIVAPFKSKDNKTKAKTLGAIGVIGPIRVNYGKIIPMVDFTAQAISKLFK
ncbi:MAG: heat-inducible transcriptional repressor HrcA [Pelagibacterales bacterium]|nr:heat-inducible transcriptional repressor HrcA [Pelagibacterales bacterium]PPR16668.1 MAG: Heat-inducible transcription repressor HrcA [Alphaproteobacteria bacterium MarineAlpha9_Bin3]